MSRRRLAVGLVGCGRLGRVYARDLATRIPEARLVVVADIDPRVAQEIGDAFGAESTTDPLAVVGRSDVEAIVIVSPTSTHKELVIEAARAKKPVFCEKPPALSVEDTRVMRDAAREAGTFVQMGFMRRFDPGYLAAKKRLDAGTIGAAVLFKSTSRDPYRTSLEYADPRISGGMILDMGIHDFDLARWLIGEVRSVHAIAGTLAYPELETVGDIDNAVVTLSFADGRLGVVDLSRNGVYGYDIHTELLGTAGTLRVGYLCETPLLVMTKNSIAHDTVPHFMERFAAAYTAQLQNFVRNVLDGRPAPVTLDDGLAALRIAVAAQRSVESGAPVAV